MAIQVVVPGELAAALTALESAGASQIEPVAGGTAGLFPSGDVGALRRAFPNAQVMLAELRDWGSTWVPAIRPVVVGPLRIVPLGTGEPAPDDLVIAAADAFGTGVHPTTQLCLERLVERTPRGAVLDLGTGTGVLALAARRLGVARVVGTDTDRAALDSAARNAVRNGITGIELCDAAPDALGEQFSLVLANVLAAPLLALAPALVRALGPGGEATLSGFSEPMVPEIAQAYRHFGLRILQTVTRDGWARLDLAAPW